MWSTYLFHLRSGNIGPRLHFSNASWDMTINETETFQGTISKSAIPMLDSSLWLEPWWAGVALMWNSTPIFAGPIIARPSENFTTMSIACKGIRAALAERTVTRDMPDWGKIADPLYVQNWSTDGQYNGGTQSPPVENSPFYQKTYASIARLAVEESMTKLGGELPINFMVPIQDFNDPAPLPGLGNSDRPHYKRVAGWSGKTVDAFLTELSNTKNGPDIMFRPVLKDSRIEWDMWTGYNDELPEIYQTSDTVWDTTAPGGHITNLEVQYSGAYMSNRAFVIGPGSGGLQPIRMFENKSLINLGYPLLETYESDPNANVGAIAERARAIITADDKARHQLNATVRIDAVNEVGTFWPGEYGKLITSGWYGLKNGETRAKILTMSGDLSNNMQIGFKETEVA